MCEKAKNHRSSSSRKSVSGAQIMSRKSRHRRLHKLNEQVSFGDPKLMQFLCEYKLYMFIQVYDGSHQLNSHPFRAPKWSKRTISTHDLTMIVHRSALACIHVTQRGDCSMMHLQEKKLERHEVQCSAGFLSAAVDIRPVSHTLASNLPIVASNLYVRAEAIRVSCSPAVFFFTIIRCPEGFGRILVDCFPWSSRTWFWRFWRENLKQKN